MTYEWRLVVWQTSLEFVNVTEKCLLVVTKLPVSPSSGKFQIKNTVF